MKISWWNLLKRSEKLLFNISLNIFATLQLEIKPWCIFHCNLHLKIKPWYVSISTIGIFHWASFWLESQIKALTFCFPMAVIWLVFIHSLMGQERSNGYFRGTFQSSKGGVLEARVEYLIEHLLIKPWHMESSSARCWNILLIIPWHLIFLCGNVRGLSNLILFLSFSSNSKHWSL